MATTIDTTALDFNSIKENLKEKFSASDQFNDYDFEASGLSSVLDVLAYNTHYNGLIANFALNESFINTAQLRSSLVGLVESIGYIPDSMSGAKATIGVTLNLSGVADRPSRLTIPTGSAFTSSIDGETYTFSTGENLYGTDNGFGVYQFYTESGSADIIITEGKPKTKEFVVTPGSEDKIYVIPDTNLDRSSVMVKVFRSRGSQSFNYYTDVADATTIDDGSRIYLLKESPNGYYDISFGDGNTFGAKLAPGNIISLSYLHSSGVNGNGAAIFTPEFEITVGNSSYVPSVTTSIASNGGADKESIQSMRKNAPFHFSSQNRMVTADDYTATILRKFPSYITDIRSYGGQDAIKPKFGTVMLCVLFNNGLPVDFIEKLKVQIKQLVERLAVVSFDVEFEDPIETYLGVNIQFDYNASQTTRRPALIEGQVKLVLESYMAENVGSFDKSFRRSNLLSKVDDEAAFILSSRADVAMIQRATPILGAVNSFTLKFPTDIATHDDITYTVTSSRFVYNDRLCMIRNRLNSNILEIINLEEGNVIADNIGTFDSVGGTISIVGFQPDRFVGGLNYMKFMAVPSNQSSITATHNHVLKYDEDESTATGIKIG
jgi:hypothetical protein